MRILGLIAAVCLSIGPASAQAAGTPDEPNIVIILSDDLGWGSIASFGGAGLTTPATDRLAKEGRRFTFAYAPGSVCSPTRYGIMTGRYIWRTPVNNGFGLGDADPLLIEKGRITLGSLAKMKGYNTAVIGKWHIGLGVPTTIPKQLRWDAPLDPGPLAVGFDYFFGIAANVGNQPDAYIEQDMLIDRVPGMHVTIEGKGNDAHTVGIKPLRVPDQVMGMLTDKALAWLDKNHDKPFLLYFAPNAVHAPITPSAKFTGSKFGKYGDFIQELDADVQRLLDFLDKNNLTDNTIVIFTSDNGGVIGGKGSDELLAAQGGLKINGDLKGGKHSIWEGGFREPFIVRWPGKVPAGTVCNDTVCHTDLLATLASILDVKLPENGAEDSFDVSASWFGTEGGTPPRDTVILHSPQGCTYAVRKGPWKFIENEDRPPYNAMNDTYIKKSIDLWRTTLKPPKDQLYNVVTDPSETTDVAAAHQDIVQQCREILKEAREKGRTRAE
jgi:arylsulfatase A-like enzyme